MKVITSPKQKIGQADPMLYGHFLEHFQRQIYGGVYDPTSRFADEDGFRTDVLEAIRDIKPAIIRWPGGCFVSAYDWHFGVGKVRIPTFDKAWRVEESNEFGTDEFVKFCRKVGCEPYICTNAGTGTPEEMSNWVEYCNLKKMGRFARERIANGYEEPHAIKFWSIGNENWGGHEIGAKTAGEWSRLVQEAAKMMLRVDPTLELSAAAIANLDWNTELLKKAGDYLDWVSIHDYWVGAQDGVTFPDYDSIILRTGEDLSQSIDRVRAHLTAMGLEKKIKIAYDEWNLRGWYHPYIMDIWNRENKRNEDETRYNEIINERGKNDVNSVYTMADALFSACFLNTCLRNCDIVQMACFSPIVNTRGAIFTHEDGIVLRPQYFVFKLYANLMKQTVLDIWTEDVPAVGGQCDSVDHFGPGMGGQNAGKRVDLVDVVVTYGDGSYVISAVNKDAYGSHFFDLSLLEGQLREMRIHTVNGPSADSYNDIGRTEVGITTTEWMPFTGSITLEPHSVNVIELR